MYVVNKYILYAYVYHYYVYVKKIAKACLVKKNSDAM